MYWQSMPTGTDVRHVRRSDPPAVSQATFGLECGLEKTPCQHIIVSGELVVIYEVSGDDPVLVFKHQMDIFSKT